MATTITPGTKDAGRALKTLQEKILEADERGNRYLADANEAAEKGDQAKADALYAKSQYWLATRREVLLEKTDLTFLVNRYVQHVAEFDRTTPGDQPDDMLLITCDELAELLRDFADDLRDLGQGKSRFDAADAANT